MTRPMTPKSTRGRTIRRSASGGAQSGPLSSRDLELIDAYWRASNYLSVGQIYLLDNPLLRQHQTGAPLLIVGNQSVRRYVRFSSLGEPLLPTGAFQAGTLHICASRQSISHHQVVLSRSGRVSLRHDQAEQALCAGSKQGANP